MMDLSSQRKGTWRTKSRHMADTWTYTRQTQEADKGRTKRNQGAQVGHKADNGGQALETRPAHIAASLFLSLRENPTVNCLGEKKQIRKHVSPRDQARPAWFPKHFLIAFPKECPHTAESCSRTCQVLFRVAGARGPRLRKLAQNLLCDTSI